MYCVQIWVIFHNTTLSEAVLLLVVEYVLNLDRAMHLLNADNKSPRLPKIVFKFYSRMHTELSREPHFSLLKKNYPTAKFQIHSPKS